MTLKFSGIDDPTDGILTGAVSKADRKRNHRITKHAMINQRIVYLRGKYKGMTAAQRASEARQYADKTLSEMRKAAEILSA